MTVRDDAKVAERASIYEECAQLCEGQTVDVDETGNGDEYRRGQVRGALSCAAVIRSAIRAEAVLGPPENAPTPRHAVHPSANHGQAVLGRLVLDLYEAARRLGVEGIRELGELTEEYGTCHEDGARADRVAVEVLNALASELELCDR